MKQRIFAAYVAAVIMCVMSLSSCMNEALNTALGVDDEDKMTETKLEDVVYSHEFAVRPYELYTVEQSLKGYAVKYQNNTVIGQESFTRNLNLNVLCSALEDVYVQTEAELTNVVLKGATHEKAKTDTIQMKYANLVRTTQSHSFRFDQNEVVDVTSVYEKLAYKEDLPYAEIRPIVYKDFTSVLNEELSDADRSVYTVTLMFDADVVVKQPAISRAVDAEVEKYTIEVSYNRIYKYGSVPEDKYVETIYNWSRTIKGTYCEYSVTSAEIWSVSGQKNEMTENLTTPFGVKAPSAQIIYSDNANYQTTSKGMSGNKEQNSVDGHWSVTTRTQNYTSTASNGLNPFNNVYEVTDAKVVYTRNEVKIEFPYGNWAIKEGDTTIGAPVEQNGYDVYPYVNNISYVYAIEEGEAEGSALAKRSIYVGKTPEVPSERKVISWTDVVKGDYRECTVTTAKVLSNGERVDELTETKSVYNGIKAPSAQTIYSDNAKYQTTSKGMSGNKEQNSVDGHWSVTTRTQNYTSTASNGLNPFNNVYTVNDAKLVYSYEGATVEFPYGKWTISEGNSNITGPTANGDYEVYSYVNNIDYVYAITSESSRGNAKAEASIYVKKAQDVITENVTGSAQIEGDDVVITVTVQEEGTISGKHDPVTETIKLPLVWNNPTMQSIYTANTNYSTRSNGWKAGNESSRKEGNFTVKTRTSSYSSKANNGDKAFDNVYRMTDYKVIYTSKSGKQLTFDYGKWNIEEGQSTVGNSVAEGDYNVSVYTNNVNYVYSLTNGSSKNGKGVSQAKLYVAKPAERIIPENWGKIVGAGISAVPNDDHGEANHNTKKCLLIRTTKGAVAVAFGWDKEICSVNNILNGYFVEGSFDASYNSGYYTTDTNKGSYAINKWAPAKAQDLSNRIAYYNGSTCVRNVPFSTLLMWGWVNGNSTVVDGYTFNVSDNGTLTVSYNGKTVMSIR